MNKNQINGHSSAKNSHDEDDFELMGDFPKEDPVIAERRRLRENEITKKLGEYLLKGYCMLNDACPECNCILLRTPESQLLCVGCNDIDMINKEIVTTDKKKDSKKRSKKPKNKKQRNDSVSNCNQLEDKLKWAVNELTKSQNPNRINEMCTVIIKLTETIKILKEHELTSTDD